MQIRECTSDLIFIFPYQICCPPFYLQNRMNRPGWYMQNRRTAQDEQNDSSTLDPNSIQYLCENRINAFRIRDQNKTKHFVFRRLHCYSIQMKLKQEKELKPKQEIEMLCFSLHYILYSAILKSDSNDIILLHYNINCWIPVMWMLCIQKLCAVLCCTGFVRLFILCRNPNLMQR